ncbi:tyrosine--tRNA ligase [Sinomonas sp. ASV322]|uniref:tyrosine--tRNA ligase n=1 Tax=Sinomonas sp. ASV322 TaxID=3041920 RepID=UPI0027DE38D7|nr:tyrosine--tRNA ligase [Sinomonas sp. ASV322]MDQ4504313.1 tyrosine--tRNA ligase [Sinomonas sp. ASV322]
MTDVDAVLAPMWRTIDRVVGEGDLRKMLASGRQLRIKYGVDCTAPDLHLGHAVNLWLMRHLQDHGHRVLFLLGDLTTRVGDPTGKSQTRPVLSPEEIEANAAAFLGQVGLVLNTNPSVFEVRRNSEWYDRMSVAEMLSLFSMTTHAQLMERDMFRQREAEGREIAFHELAYPVLQGYDSVALESDLTIVGSDQLFNELMGRTLQQRHGRDGQVVVTTRITPGLDGGPKQSKSLGNYVALTDSPGEKFGKIMSLPDHLVSEWAQAYSELSDDAVEALKEAATAGGAAARDAKLDLAEAIVWRYHGNGEARLQRDSFLAVFSDRAVPTDIPELAIPQHPLTVLELVALAQPALSITAARRLVAEGAVRLDGDRLSDPQDAINPTSGAVLRIGKRYWLRLVRG